jgi:hypothetical protein
MSDEPKREPDAWSDVTRWIGIGLWVLSILAWGLVFWLWKFGLPDFILRLLTHL